MSVYQWPREPLQDARWRSDNCDHKHRSREAAERCERQSERRQELAGPGVPEARICDCGGLVIPCEDGPGVLAGGETGTVECLGWVHAGEGWHLCHPDGPSSVPVAKPASQT